MNFASSFDRIALLLLLFAAIPTRPALAADSPFENEIRAFEAADRKQPPPRDAVLFIGSSSIRFWTTLAQDFPDIKTIRRGFGGSQITDCTRYVDRIVVPYHPSQIAIYAGDNDIAAGKSPEQVRTDFEGFVTKVRVKLPDVAIRFISIKPSLARWKLIDKIKRANRLIRDYAKSHKNISYIDVFAPMLNADGKPRKELLRPDGLHMTAKGYNLWTSIIKRSLNS
jgi:lysophospholipase L1-like esterase